MSLPVPTDPPLADAIPPMEGRCRLCRRPMRPDMLFCRECGTPVQRYHYAPAHVTVTDYLLAVGSGLLAMAVTLPMTGMLLSELNRAQRGEAISMIVSITLWNGWFLGIPLFACGRRWIWRIRRGEFDHRLAWREYWQIQCATLLPVFMVLSCVIVSYLWMGLQWLLSGGGLNDLS